jgi:hypothetical protein
MQRLFHRSLKSEKRIQMYFCYIKLGPRLYWLIRNFEIQKLFSVLKKIIAVFSHSLFYNVLHAFTAFFQRVTCTLKTPYTPIMEYDKNMFKFICTISLWFNSSHCCQLQFSKVFFSTKIYHANYAFAGKNLSPQKGITISKSLDSLILMKTTFWCGS